MTDDAKPGIKGQRQRSPSYPYVSLPVAIDRLRAFYAVNKRYEALIADSAQPWNMKATSSSVLRNVAALVAFGLLEESGSAETRKIRVSDAGWKILHEERQEQKDRLIVDAALKPKAIADCFLKWGVSGDGRPGDKVALSVLKVEMGFSVDAAEHFLRVYDETIGFAHQHGLHLSLDGVMTAAQQAAEPFAPKTEEMTQDQRNSIHSNKPPTEARPSSAQSPSLTAQDAGWTTFLEGPLSGSVRFRLLASGHLGHKELGKLIKLLETQRMILSDHIDDSDSQAPA